MRSRLCVERGSFNTQFAARLPVVLVTAPCWRRSSALLACVWVVLTYLLTYLVNGQSFPLEIGMKQVTTNTCRACSS